MEHNRPKHEVIEVSRNSTDFPLRVYTFLKSLKYDHESVILYHQHLVREYLLAMPRLRGILVYHGYGTGKTRLATAIVHDVARAGRKLIVLAPKTVHTQFRHELRITGRKPVDVSYISIKASNMTAQVQDEAGAFVQDDDTPIMQSLETLENTFLVIDEAHNLFNAICNGAKNGLDLYDLIMQAKNIKILFLTGSPIVNDPFELVPCYNMLAGMKLFPEVKEDFDRYFVNSKGNMINEEKFKNRIMGLTTYYGDWIRRVEATSMPKELEIQIVKIKMSADQYSVYSSYREKEREESSRSEGFRGSKPVRFSNRSKSSTTYRVNSRMASNMVPVRDITDKQLQDPKHCPKFHKCIEIIDKRPTQKGLIYSEFVHNAGIIDIGRLLALKGWRQWDVETDFVGEKNNLNNYCYGLMYGDIPEKDRNSLQASFNDPRNNHGEYIRVILMGPSGAEGISFKSTRYVVNVSPFFNYTRTEQVKHRIKRYMSHSSLPKSEQTVQTFILIADYPDTAKPPMTRDRPGEPLKVELSTDEQLLRDARANKLLHMKFYKAMVEASIDCAVHRDRLPKSDREKIKCKMCTPNHVPLFHDKLDVDIEKDDPCTTPAHDELTVEEIIIDVDGQPYKFMYRLDPETGYEFYEFNEQLDNWTRVPRNHRFWDLLIEKVTARAKN